MVNAHAASTVSAFSNRFNVFVWMGENDLKTLLLDANIFENGEKSYVLNENGFMWMGLKSDFHSTSVVRIANPTDTFYCNETHISSHTDLSCY